MLTQSMDCNVFMLEYRGYGLSTGTPDEAGIVIDAQTALDYIRQRAETQNDQVVVYGQSLGGAVAVGLVAKNQHDKAIAGLILENTFLSMRKLIPQYAHRPHFRSKPLTDFSSAIPPAKYLASLCHQIWASESIIHSITEVPILFLSGLQDEIVP